MQLLLLLLQLAHHPTKDSGRGLSLLRAPSIPPVIIIIIIIIIITVGSRCEVYYRTHARTIPKLKNRATAISLLSYPLLPHVLKNV